MFHKLTAKNCHGFPYMIETVYLRVIGMRCWWSNWGTFENYKISWGDHIDHFIAVYFSFPIPENKLFGTDYTSIYVVLFNFFKRHTIQLSPFRHKDAWTESAQELVELGCLSFGSLRVFSNLIKSISVLSGLAYTICRLPTSAKDSSVPFVVKLALHSYFWYRYSDESAGVSAVHVWSADL